MIQIWKLENRKLSSSSVATYPVVKVQMFHSVWSYQFYSLTNKQPFLRQCKKLSSHGKGSFVFERALLDPPCLKFLWEESERGQETPANIWFHKTLEISPTRGTRHPYFSSRTQISSLKLQPLCCFQTGEFSRSPTDFTRMKLYSIVALTGVVVGKSHAWNFKCKLDFEHLMLRWSCGIFLMVLVLASSCCSCHL